MHKARLQLALVVSILAQLFAVYAYAQIACNTNPYSCRIDRAVATGTTVAGTTYTCVFDHYAPNTRICRPATTSADGSTCDIAEYCTGTSSTCPANTRQLAGTVCRAASNVCDRAEICNGTSSTCPANAPEPNGVLCNDSNLCTQADACLNGLCKGTDVVCPAASDQCHNQGTCNPATGACSDPAKADNTACNDTNACTTSDTCQSGACTGASVTCTALDQCHTAGTCVAATGVCSNPVASGATCNDSNACTIGETCNASGTCTGGAARNCSDGLTCTTDRCTSTGCINTVNRGSCLIGGACYANGDTNPANPCQMCNSSVRPKGWSLKPAGSSCTADALFCTDDVCNGTDVTCTHPKKSGCVCEPGATQACYTGPAGTQGVGICRGGTQTCSATGTWGTCAGEVVPVAETCNDIDDDCDGAIDENIIEACTVQGAVGICAPGRRQCATGRFSACEPIDQTTICGSDECFTGKTCQRSGQCGGGTAVHDPAPNSAPDCFRRECQLGQGWISTPDDTQINQSCNDSDACTSADTCADLFTPVALAEAQLNNAISAEDQEEAELLALQTGADAQIAACIGGVEESAASAARLARYEADAQARSEGRTLTAAELQAIYDARYREVYDAQIVACNQQRTDFDQQIAEQQQILANATAAKVSAQAVYDTALAQYNEAVANRDICRGTMNPDVGNPCTEGIGACSRNGEIRCASSTGALSCSATPAAPGIEVCNNTDDDCDGAIDNLAPEIEPCGLGICSGGARQRECSTGLWSEWSTCSTAGWARPEVCNGLDDDCDGVADNGLTGDATCLDDGNPCTVDVIVGTGCAARCEHNPGNTGTECRASAGECDVAESCDGKLAACPADTFRAAKTSCRTSEGECDLAEECTGSSAACPADAFKSNTTECRAADRGNACDAAEFCSGSNAACPSTDANRPDGTVCSDENACTQTDTCQAGACTGANPIVCTASDQCHNAGTCDRTTGRCSNPAKADDTTCDDGNDCTENDTCSAGICQAGAQKNCADQDACTIDGCSAGACTHEPDTACVCVAGEIRACTKDRCTGTQTCLENRTGFAECVTTTCTCDEALKPDCGTGPCAGTTTCNTTTGNWTTCDYSATAEVECRAKDTADACDLGAKCSGSASMCPESTRITVCTSGDGCCADGCSAGDDHDCAGCGNGRLDEGEQCDTAIAAGESGACPTVCADDGNFCTEDIIEGSACTARCSHPPKTDAVVCDDGNACTEGDSCKAGACGGTPKACASSDACRVNGLCGEGGECAYDTITACANNDNCCPAGCNSGNDNDCEPGCGNGFVDAGELCDTTIPEGSAGACPKTCDAGSAGVCKMVALSKTGTCLAVCETTNKSDETPCDNDTVCDGHEVCRSGVCENGSAPVCDDHNPCTDNSCDPVAGCKYANNTAACEDGSACTENDTCSAGICQAGAQKDCDDRDACTIDTCSAGTCSHANNPACVCTAGETRSCTKDRCTGTQVCLENRTDFAECVTTTCTCNTAARPDCGTGDCAGTTTCDTVAGNWGACVYPAGVACDDGDACTTVDSCNSTGTCVGTSEVVCTASDQCHNAGVCGYLTGRCSNPPKINDTVCTDTSLCSPTCQNGVCTGVPITTETCNGLDDNCDGEVDEGGVCGVCAIGDTRPCGDVPACQGSQTCLASGNFRAWSQCDFSAVANTHAECDSNLCTTGDTCTPNGTCLAGTTKTCADTDACTADSCEPSTGLCVFAPQAGLACDDRNACTIGDTCNSSGACAESTSQITECKGADGCCPAGCNTTPANMDTDCPAGCGNGIVEAGELCDTGITDENITGACPNACPDSDRNACTLEAPVGELCQKHCVVTTTTDGCSIAGACRLTGEHNPENACQICSSAAPDAWTTIVECANGDGCCDRTRCSTANDNDCSAVCGNGILESGERCDTAIPPGELGACMHACPDDGDNNTCTSLRLVPNGCLTECLPEVNDGCSIEGACVGVEVRNAADACLICRPGRSQTAWTAIDERINGDGCCAEGSTATLDNDCPGCGNGRVEAGEACDQSACEGSMQCHNCQCVQAEPSEEPHRPPIEGELPESIPVKPEITNIPASCTSYCDGASDQVKKYNESATEITGWTGNLFCNSESARLIIVCTVPLQGAAQTTSGTPDLGALSWMFVQDAGRGVVPADPIFRERTPGSIEKPVLLLSSIPIETARSVVLPLLSKSAPISELLPLTNATITETNGQMELNGGIITHSATFAPRMGEPFSMKLGNESEIQFAAPMQAAAELASTTAVEHHVFTVVLTAGATWTGVEGGPTDETQGPRNPDEVLGKLADLRDKADSAGVPVTTDMFTDLPWNSGDNFRFSIIQTNSPAPLAVGLKMADITALGGPFGEEGGGSGGCSITREKNMNIIAPIVLLLILALLAGIFRLRYKPSPARKKTDLMR